MARPFASRMMAKVLILQFDRFLMLNWAGLFTISQLRKSVFVLGDFTVGRY